MEIQVTVNVADPDRADPTPPENLADAEARREDAERVATESASHSDERRDAVLALVDDLARVASGYDITLGVKVNDPFLGRRLVHGERW